MNTQNLQNKLHFLKGDSFVFVPSCVRRNHLKADHEDLMLNGFFMSHFFDEQLRLSGRRCFHYEAAC